LEYLQNVNCIFHGAKLQLLLSFFFLGNSGDND
jgi:hypothetical protein